VTLFFATYIRKVMFFVSSIINKIMTLLFSKHSELGLLMDPWTIIPILTILISFLFRSIPPFKQLWWFFKWFFIMLLVVLSVNYAKKEVKEWWKKD
jgi:hypothetical protein